MSALPFELTACGPDGARWTSDATALEVVSAAGSDLFIDPSAPGQASADLTRLTGEVAGPFQLGARVTVDFRDRFDAGVLVVWADPTTWLKLCFEFSPAGRGSVVSVVTRGVSDDANAWDVPGDTVYLRISRMRHAFALHSSADGRAWQLVRVCSLGVPIDRPVEVGFLSQSPNGAGCRAVFEDVTFATRELSDTRDGS
jgi:regulation of enolase protein 1 (concanavalin A-like superfamily)